MNSGMESLGRLRLTAVLLLAGVFVVGALAGAAWERLSHHRPGPPPHDHHGGPPHGLPPEFTEGLDLTPAQVEQMEEIIERHRPAMESVLDEFLPRLRTVSDSTRAEARAVLTPEQQKIFDRRDHPAFRGEPAGWGPPRPRPPREGHGG